jgi:tetratricopeptide (TPR) repeat protein
MAQAALAIFTELGDKRTIADLQGLLAECAFKDGRREDARDLWLAALDVFTSLGDRPGTAPIMIELGSLDLDDGRFDAALEQLGAARRLAEEMKDPWTHAAALAGLARHAHVTGENTLAYDLLDQAETLARQTEDVTVIRRVEALRSQWDSAG